MVNQLRKELTEARENYNVLLGHAQQKMTEANEELHRLRTGLESELSVTKAKLLKADLRVASLEGAVEAKGKENTELMTICDELIQKIDVQAHAQSAPGGGSSSAALLSTFGIGRGGSGNKS
jgi:hypothetical protein